MKTFNLTIDGKTVAYRSDSILAALRALASDRGYQSTAQLIAAHDVYMSG